MGCCFSGEDENGTQVLIIDLSLDLSCDVHAVAAPSFFSVDTFVILAFMNFLSNVFRLIV